MSKFKIGDIMKIDGMSKVYHERSLIPKKVSPWLSPRRRLATSTLTTEYSSRIFRDSRRKELSNYAY